MLLTTSAKTTLPKHSAGWAVMRLVTDRGGKNLVEPPTAWGRHRNITAEEAFKLLEQRVRIAKGLMNLRETRP